MIALAKKQARRKSHAASGRKMRWFDRDVEIEVCVDKRKRRALELNIERWLRFFFGHIFTYPFTPQQREMIEAIRLAIEIGGDQAIAASRGEGKTTIAECVAIFCVLTGLVKFIVLFAATGPDATDSLSTIKSHLETNDKLLEFYPEVCRPIRALENTPNRAHYQTVSGERHDTGKRFSEHLSRFVWCGREIKLPSVPGSRAGGAYIATRGLDSAVRGLKKGDLRPEVAIIDDPDTEETISSEEQAAKLSRKIDRAIAGLGGQKRRIARVLLVTLQSRTGVGYLYTDATSKPSWNAKRFRFMIHPPERQDLWDEFVSLQENDWRDQTTFARDLYAGNRKAMDAGGVVANKHRFADGELSAIQHYYTWVARIGRDAVATELDNDPPEELVSVASGLTAKRIMLKLSGYERRVVPPETLVVTQGVDVQKSGIFFVVKAWQSDATNYVIDYGFVETHGTTYGSEDGVEFAVKRAILERFEQQVDEDYAPRTSDGRLLAIDLTLVDSGWQTQAVYSACREIGGAIVYPSKGHGKSHGCATPNFYDQLKRTNDRQPVAGGGAFRSRLPGGAWLVHADTDRWKSFDHARWMTADGKPGAAYVFGVASDSEIKFIDKRLPAASKDHFSYAHHLTSELEVDDIVKGIPRKVWKIRAGRVQNHYLDASYLADVAAAMKGIQLLGPPTIKTATQELSLAEMAQAARGGSR
jgi:hypothetical protein